MRIAGGAGTDRGRPLSPRAQMPSQEMEAVASGPGAASTVGGTEVAEVPMTAGEFLRWAQSSQQAEAREALLARAKESYEVGCCSHGASRLTRGALQTVLWVANDQRGAVRAVLGDARMRMRLLPPYHAKAGNKALKQAVASGSYEPRRCGLNVGNGEHPPCSHTPRNASEPSCQLRWFPQWRANAGAMGAAL
jgi:hypothetical protein